MDECAHSCFTSMCGHLQHQRIGVKDFSWISLGFPDSSVGKEFTCNAGDLGLILMLGRSPREGKAYPLWNSGLENSTDRIIQWGGKQLDMTERLSLSLFIFTLLLTEEEMATHSSVFAWRIPWTEEPGGLQSMGSQRVRHNWSNQALTT